VPKLNPHNIFIRMKVDRRHENKRSLTQKLTTVNHLIQSASYDGNQIW
jgi:uncharacterized protein YqgV (UPF0045/DUF77 family)